MMSIGVLRSTQGRPLVKSGQPARGILLVGSLDFGGMGGGRLWWSGGRGLWWTSWTLVEWGRRPEVVDSVEVDLFDF